ncbi:hypothetical protein BJ085DRAFT_33539 [Dimargaris cristalligena]|uniref:Pentacotripeptide-repeat region of PRORP domain-containing protein n=1 Tax=Dimargaris cristalligena TaxID=215637 RepID=A0A4V1J565_9FUNG|nr:hypothetical protein BJ085DRAFT_33539 [Dimargaris cristalligena]|eukprot:RKP37979.1 hypothetical protein BJ085DRAFT_33539 [Dimargaris cristalligena]
MHQCPRHAVRGGLGLVRIPRWGPFPRLYLPPPSSFVPLPTAPRSRSVSHSAIEPHDPSPRTESLPPAGRRVQPDRIHPSLSGAPPREGASLVQSVAEFNRSLTSSVSCEHLDYVVSLHRPLAQLGALWHTYQQLRRDPSALTLVSAQSLVTFLRVLLGQMEVLDVEHTWRQRMLPRDFSTASPDFRCRFTYTAIVTCVLADLRSTSDLESNVTHSIHELAAMIYGRAHAWAELEGLWATVTVSWVAQFEASLGADWTAPAPADPPPNPAPLHRHMIKMASARILYYARAHNFTRCDAIDGELQFRYNLSPSRFILSTLLCAYAETGQIERAEQALHTLTDRGYHLTIHEYNALLAGYGQMRMADRVDALWQQLTTSDHPPGPNFSTYQILCHFHLDLGHPDRVKPLLEDVKQLMVSTASLHKIALIRRLMDHGLMEESEAQFYTARDIFDRRHWTLTDLFIRRGIYSNDPDMALRAFRRLLRHYKSEAALVATDGIPPGQLKIEASFLHLFLWLLQRDQCSHLEQLCSLFHDTGIHLGPVAEAMVENALNTRLRRFDTPLTNNASPPATPPVPREPPVAIQRLFESPWRSSLLTLLREYFPPEAAPDLGPLVQQLSRVYALSHRAAFDTVIKILTDRHDFSAAQRFFLFMTGQGYRPSVYIYSLVLRGLVWRNLLPEAEALRQRMLGQFGLTSPPHALKSLLAGYVRQDQLVDAKRVFLELTDTRAHGHSLSAGLAAHVSHYNYIPLDLHGYTVVMQLFGRYQDVGMVEHCYHTILRLGIRPDLKVFNALLHVYSEAQLLAPCRSIYQALLDAGLAPDHETGHLIIRAHALGGSVADLSFLYNDLCTRDVRLSSFTYNHIIQALVRTEAGFKPALELFRRMWMDSVAPGTPFTPTNLQQARDGFFRKNPDLWQHLVPAAQQADVRMDAAPAPAHAPLDNLADPDELDEGGGDDDMLPEGVVANPYIRLDPRTFHLYPRTYRNARPPCPNSLTFKILIRAAGRQRRWHVAVALFELQRSSLYFSPDLRTYGWAITAFTQLQDHASAMKYWSEFQSAPSFEVAQNHYHWSTLKELVAQNLSRITCP